VPIGEYGPYPERLRDQFEGVIRRFRSGAQRREMPGEFDITQALVVVVVRVFLFRLAVVR